jgi:hypothetical protein
MKITSCENYREYENKIVQTIGITRKKFEKVKKNRKQKKSKKKFEKIINL